MALLEIASVTYETIRDEIIAIFQSERPNASANRYDDLWLYSKILARMVQRLHWSVDRALSAVHPWTTHGIYLDWWLELRGLGGRIQAGGSSAASALTVTATGAANVPIGTQFTDTGGRVYQTTVGNVFVGAGTFDFDMEAVSTGLATNLQAGEILTIVSPIANITDAATLIVNLEGGTDLETDAAGRQRLKEDFQNPSASGNVADWVKTIKSASPGAIDAFVWPWRNNSPSGWGYTDYCALRRGENRGDRHIAAVDALYTTIDDAVLARMPAIGYANSRQLTLTDNEQSVNVSLTLADYATSSQRCDFDAETLDAVVDSVNFATLEIDTDKDVTVYMSVGDKAVIWGAQAVVAAVGLPTCTNDTCFRVTTWFSVYDADDNPYPWPATTIPMATPQLCSGGGVIMDVVTAIMEYGDSLGPAEGTYAASITGWQSVLKTLGIQTAAINAVPGVVVDVTVNTPLADVTPTAGTGPNTERIILDDVAVLEIK